MKAGLDEFKTQKVPEVQAAVTTVTRNGDRGTKVVVSLILIAAILLGGFLAVNAGYTEYLRFTGQLEIRKAEAEAAKLQAQREADLAAADKIRAEGERELNTAMGAAIKAPSEAAAHAVVVQSNIIAFWGFGGPIFLLLIYVFVKRRAPELPVAWQKAQAEFVEAWEKAKAEYEERKKADDAE